MFAQYEKGYIDTHGGKEEKLIQKKIDFARQGMDFLLKSKSLKENNSTKKHIKLDDIENIKF
jgi:hypothetical protein